MSALREAGQPAHGRVVERHRRRARPARAQRHGRDDLRQRREVVDRVAARRDPLVDDAVTSRRTHAGARPRRRRRAAWRRPGNARLDRFAEKPTSRRTRAASPAAPASASSLSTAPAPGRAGASRRCGREQVDLLGPVLGLDPAAAVGDESGGGVEPARPRVRLEDPERDGGCPVAAAPRPRARAAAARCRGRRRWAGRRASRRGRSRSRPDRRRSGRSRAIEPSGASASTVCSVRRGHRQSQPAIVSSSSDARITSSSTTPG